MHLKVADTKFNKSFGDMIIKIYIMVIGDSSCLKYVKNVFNHYTSLWLRKKCSYLVYLGKIEYLKSKIHHKIIDCSSISFLVNL